MNDEEIAALVAVLESNHKNSTAFRQAKAALFEAGLKRCTKCDETKPLTEFGKGRPDCKACLRAYRVNNAVRIKAYSDEYRVNNAARIKACSAAYVAANRDKVAAQRAKYYATHRDQIVVVSAAWRGENRVNLMWYHAKRRATQAGLPFNIAGSDIVIPSHCPILDLPLEAGGDKRDTSPSLDRLFGKLGYIKGAVNVISDRANRIRNSASLWESWRLAEFYEQVEAGGRFMLSGQHPEHEAITRRLLNQARYRAKKYDRTFTITVDDIYVPTHCPVLGITMSGPKNGQRHDASFSLERLDNSRGYEPGNILVISWRANELCSDASADELRKIHDYFDKAQRNPTAPRPSPVFHKVTWRIERGTD